MTVLLFDIDNTLLDFDAAEYTALGRIFAHYGVADTADNRRIYAQENQALWRQNERGQISREELLKTRFVKAFEQLKLPLPADGKVIDDEYETYLSQGHQLMRHAKALLDLLKARQAEMYVVSNGTSKVTRPRILESGILPYFQDVFISEEVGAQKPDKAFFDKAFAHIENASSKDFVIVGDSLTSDMLGGANAGIHTIWFNPKHQPKPEQPKIDFEIDDLLEIPDLLAKF